MQKGTRATSASTEILPEERYGHINNAFRDGMVTMFLSFFGFEDPTQSLD